VWAHELRSEKGGCTENEERCWEVRMTSYFGKLEEPRMTSNMGQREYNIFRNPICL
jgi:hypothetical protein